MKFKVSKMSDNIKFKAKHSPSGVLLTSKKEQTFKKTFAFLFAMFLVLASLFQAFFTVNFLDSRLMPLDAPETFQVVEKPLPLTQSKHKQSLFPVEEPTPLSQDFQRETPSQTTQTNNLTPPFNLSTPPQPNTMFEKKQTTANSDKKEIETSQTRGKSSILTQSQTPRPESKSQLINHAQQKNDAIEEKESLAKSDFFDLYESSENGFGDIFEKELDSLDLKVFDQFIKSLPDQFFFDTDIKTSIKKLLDGDFFASDETFFSGLSKIFLGDLKQILPQFALILSATLMVGFFSNLSSDHLSSGIENVVNFSLILAVILLSTTMIISTVKEVGNSIFSLQSQMNAIFPILLTLVFALGGTASVSVYSPTLYILSSVMVNIITKIVFPLFLMAYGISILSSMTESFNLSKISDFFKSVSKYVVGITFTVFFATITLKGISVSTVDSVTLRTAKYAISSSVPLVGGYLKDGFDLIMFSLLLVKNSVGVLAAFLAIATILSPISKLVLLILLFKMVEGLTQPFASKRLSGFFAETGKSLGLVLGVFLSVFFMYAISIIILMVSTNLIL